MQSDIFGGGSTKKFWNMYKGSTSYDSFDDADTEVIDELKEDSDEELLRISKEYQDPEDAPNASTKRKITKKGKTVIVAYKPSKSKMNEIYDALKSKNIGKITDLLEEITEKKKTRRENQSNDYEEDGYKGEAQHEKRKTKSYVEKEWIELAKKIIEATSAYSTVIKMDDHFISFIIKNVLNFPKDNTFKSECNVYFLQPFFHSKRK